MIYLYVDKDGTEKASNNRPFKGDEFKTTNKEWNMNYPNPEKFKGKWYNDYSNGYFIVPWFTGVVLPKGTIKKLIGQELTHDNIKCINNW